MCVWKVDCGWRVDSVGNTWCILRTPRSMGISYGTPRAHHKPTHPTGSVRVAGGGRTCAHMVSRQFCAPWRGRVADVQTPAPAADCMPLSHGSRRRDLTRGGRAPRLRGMFVSRVSAAIVALGCPWVVETRHLGSHISYRLMGVPCVCSRPHGWNRPSR